MNFEKLNRLLLAASEGELSVRDRAELNSALLADAELRSQAVEWLCEESLLHAEATSMITPTGDLLDLAALKASHAPPYTRPVAPATRSFWAPLGAAALACSLLLNVFLWGDPQEPRVADAEAATGFQGARLTKVTGCIWEPSASTSPARGRVLQGGETLKLQQGIAEIDLQVEGARASVRLLGPCTAIVRLGEIPELVSGRMVADISVYGQSLRVETPVGLLELSDDASLGILKNDSGYAVHMLDGVAVWAGPPHALGVEPGVEAGYLLEGEAIARRFAGTEEAGLRRVSADSDMFAEELSMATDRLSAGPRYAQLVMASKPAGFWRFNRKSSGLLVNEVEGGIEMKIGGEVSSVTYGENYALEFGMTRRAGYLYADQPWPAAPLKEFSAEVWVKPSHFHNGSIFALTVESELPNRFANHAVLVELGGSEFHWRSRTPLNSLRYLLRDPPSNVPEGEFGTSINHGYEVRRWHHLAYVKRADRLELYRNGELISKDPCNGEIASGMQLVCGRLYPHLAERLFVGQLDELAIYERPLSETEVREHYFAGDIDSEPNDAI
ncbi:hypothetical protein Mal64_30330 [Pseudobythopirellula maris]|uniref:LamG-like jellyroll fold domain-containing protein n=1 Tax=Pseudobythopirellula maris TaxID=2527991 RepID=A0A5C5ZJE0_9BACT|nr:LamG domain-containing protein [Pseudobythopirellula maris]TWT87494.1 hypothetical protein Mal64_30330 [Pseudobythopirellula maris]